MRYEHHYCCRTIVRVDCINIKNLNISFSLELVLSRTTAIEDTIIYVRKCFKHTTAIEDTIIYVR
jgi:hypothetical protein